MSIKSPLSDLSETINQVRESAVQYRDTLQRNEAATRAVLIDPILRVLGWDTANIRMVEIEKTLDQTRVDYALYDRNKNVRLTVEAKSLDGNLNDPSILNKLYTYAFTHKTRKIFITDGLIWNHIPLTDPESTYGERVLRIDFTKDNIVDCAAYLIQHLDAARFWPEEPHIDELAQRIAQLESKLGTLQIEISQLRQTVREVHVPVPSALPVVVTPSLPMPVPSSTSKGFVELTQIGDAKGTKPSQLRLPDGTVVRVREWKDILLLCCKFAFSNNPNIRVPFHDRIGRKIRLLDTARPTAGAFSEENYQGQKIYIYTNYDSRNSIANAVHILNQVDRSLQKTSAAVIFA